MRRTLLIALVLAAVALGGGRPAAAATPPQVLSTWVTDVTSTSANLRAQLNAGGIPTYYRFQYLTQAEFEKGGFAGAKQLPASGESYAGAGSSPVEVTQHVGGLTPSTAYRYRVVASSTGGTTPGPDRPLGTEESAPVFHLPDSRAWEMVSPVDKGGGAVGAPGTLFGGGDFQAASQGSALTYSSATAFSGPKGAPPVSQYLATRTSSGWSTQDLSPSQLSASYPEAPDGAPFRLFSADLSRAVMLDPSRCATEESCPPSYSLWSGGSFSALPEAAELRFEGSSPDLHHVVLSSEGKLYEWSGGGLTQLSAGPNAKLAASLGAISEDGARVYLTVGEDGPLELREGASAKVLPETTGVGAAFQGASASGQIAYFLKGAHLYRYSSTTEEATDITPSGGVAGALGVSADGSSAFYQDATGLWRWKGGVSTEVASGSEATLSADWPPATGSARVSADGNHLAFVSAAQLGDYENAGHAEAYLWGPPVGGGANELICASCNPTGERPRGDASIPGAAPNGEEALAYKPRALSQSGQRLFFDSGDSLALQDTNNHPDVYEWEARGEGGCASTPGCIGLISSGRSPEGASFLDASADGADAYFLTAGSLVASDPGSIDAYDARVGGGFSESIRPIECTGDACQPLPGEPEDPNPTTLLHGPENPPLLFPKEKKKKGGKHKHHVRHERHKHHHRAKKRHARKGSVRP